MPKNSDEPFISDLPGHLIRRLQQIAVAAFYEQTALFEITPVQFAALQTIRENPSIDQRSLSGAIALDASTTGGVIDRLEKRGLIKRTQAVHDRRVKQLRVTPSGTKLLRQLRPHVMRTQVRILAPLRSRESREFLRLLEILVDKNNLLSRAPHAEDEEG
jgi:DNA-binding MarR family transcriptional regulator